jgi:glycosyltransferase involved in cell wall biosynthesis
MVTVGMPIYNGERYMRAAIDSVLNQTWRDLELVISDNGSTDATPRIAQDYAARDPRVRYYRCDRNRGPAWNHNRVLELARGRYFKWAACDDVCAPELVEACVRELEADPSVVLAFPRAQLIDSEGKLLGDTGINDLATDSHDVARRFRSLISVNHKLHCVLEVFGVMRTESARRTGMFPYVARGDSIFLVRLALLGRFVQIPRVLFFNRDHPKRSIQAQQNGRQRGHTPLSRLIGGGPVPPAEWWDSSLKGKLVFPEWRLWWEYFVSPRMCCLRWPQRLACHAQWAWFTLEHIPKLVRDLLLAAEFVALGIGSRATVSGAGKAASSS